MMQYDSIELTRRCPTTLSMILLRCGNNSSLSRSQSIGNVLNSYMSSLSVSPFSFSSNQLDNIPKVDTRRRTSNVEQISDRSSGSTSSLNVSTSRLDFRRHSASPEPFIQRLGFSGDKSATNYEGQSPQFVEEETNYNFSSRPSTKVNGHSSQEHYLQHDRQKFLSMGSLRMGNHSPSQRTNLSYQHHYGSDTINGNKLTFKGKGIRKISDNGLFTLSSNVQLVSAKKLPSLEKGLDVRWEVRDSWNSLLKCIVLLM